MLTEKEAWVILAEAWSNPVWNFVGREVQVAIPDCGWANGLCASIHRLYQHGYVSSALSLQMADRLHSALSGGSFWPALRGSFIWPRTVKGAESRVLFCRERIKECELGEITNRAASVAAVS